MIKETPKISINNSEVTIKNSNFKGTSVTTADSQVERVKQSSLFSTSKHSALARDVIQGQANIAWAQSENAAHEKIIINNSNVTINNSIENKYSNFLTTTNDVIVEQTKRDVVILHKELQSQFNKLWKNNAGLIQTICSNINIVEKEDASECKFEKEELNKLIIRTQALMENLVNIQKFFVKIAKTSDDMTMLININQLFIKRLEEYKEIILQTEVLATTVNSNKGEHKLVLEDETQTLIEEIEVRRLKDANQTLEAVSIAIASSTAAPSVSYAFYDSICYIASFLNLWSYGKK